MNSNSRSEVSEYLELLAMFLETRRFLEYIGEETILQLVRRNDCCVDACATEVRYGGSNVQ
jgi:hypothetical protein